MDMSHLLYFLLLTRLLGSVEIDLNGYCTIKYGLKSEAELNEVGSLSDDILEHRMHKSVIGSIKPFIVGNWTKLPIGVHYICITPALPF